MRFRDFHVIKIAGKRGAEGYGAGMRPVIVGIALALLISPAAWAASPTDTLRQVFARADRILADPETEDRPLERLLAVRKLVGETLDFREATTLAFGRHWGAVAPADRQEFAVLLGDLLERAYISRLASSQASLGGSAQIQYLGESVEGDEAFVWTAVARRSSGEILLGYRMIERDERWKVRDVIVDGVSVGANYRAQIERVLEVASVSELLVQMREKVGRVTPPPPPESIVQTAPPRATVAVVETTPLAEPVEQIAETAQPTESVTVADTPLPTETVAAVDTSTPVLTAAVEDVSPPAPVVRGIIGAGPRAGTRVTKAYWLRLGTVEAMEESGRLAALLDERKLVVGVEPIAGAVNPLALSVRVGPFQDATEAVLKLLDLQTKGHDPVLVAERE
jgi:phospholipid transport system substrate-binding protein